MRLEPSCALPNHHVSTAELELPNVITHRRRIKLPLALLSTYVSILTELPVFMIIHRSQPEMEAGGLVSAGHILLLI